MDKDKIVEVYSKNPNKILVAAFIIISIFITICGGGIMAIYFISTTDSVVVNPTIAISDPLSKLKDGDFITAKIKNKTMNLEVAKSMSARETGLMNRYYIGANTGMLFIFEDENYQTFWMKDTLISLDIIYLDKDFKVVSFYSNTMPDQTYTTYNSIYKAKYVIETNAGFSDSINLKLGDKFSF
jgi:uncharacterized protein